ncbi:TetR/AcrR family transcriptional regulator [Domibacillus epiphyticus]|uniref:HTH tetR-type domain-containing protein n=1 Tax=Domibacillus epiphyticus TaxID=1714355 RepID=A0A1V2A709_9BACI|nr:TetR/AcrR family transcriptional regulator [Domibacillus epiphyticus]OMP66756.1 hypothetical protein BTO28_10670 [Domibacillus epiphyticus]
MNERKLKVMEAAHSLFVKKGYAATSVQDILEKSSISKGTFYNYFPSKSELLMSIFDKINHETNKRRTEVLAGRPVHDKEVFIEQIKVKMEVNKENNLFVLFQGVFVSDDAELKKFVKQHHFNELCWTQRRLIEVFNDDVRPYSADLAITLYGVVQNTVHFLVAAEERVELDAIIRYALRRVETSVNDVIQTKDMLLDSRILERLQPEFALNREKKKSALMQKIGVMQESAGDEQRELLSFLQDELRSAAPRCRVIEAVLEGVAENKDLKALINGFLHE